MMSGTTAVSTTPCLPAVALLQAGKPEFRERAISHLLANVHLQWHNLAAVLPQIEKIAEEGNDSAALLASKLHFHLNQMEESVSWALRSGRHFTSLLQMNRETMPALELEYTRMVAGSCISRYAAARLKSYHEEKVVGALSPSVSQTFSSLPRHVYPASPAVFDRAMSHASAIAGLGLGLHSSSLEMKIAAESSLNSAAVEVGVSRRAAVPAGEMHEDEANIEELERFAEALVTLTLRKAAETQESTDVPPAVKATLVLELTKQALGASIECRRLDWFHEALAAVPTGLRDRFRFVVKHAQLLVRDHVFRIEMLTALVKFYVEHALPPANGEERSIEPPSSVTAEFVQEESRRLEPYLDVAGTLVMLDDMEGLADILKRLMTIEGYGGVLLAHQIAFDIANLDRVGGERLLKLFKEEDETPASPKSSGHGDGNSEKVMDTAEGTQRSSVEIGGSMASLREALSCRRALSIRLQVLSRRNRTDLGILEQLRVATETKDSLTHTALTIAHSFMQAGTTSDVFLRSNLEWLRRATCWAKFSSTATLGVIHRGHTDRSCHLLSAYLPGSEGGGSRGGSAVYSEGGSLYALGLLHAGSSSAEVKDILRTNLQKTGEKLVPLIHGAALGLGLLEMGSADELLGNELKQLMYQDDAVVSEAAALALGLVFMGSANARVLTDLENYARDTRHERLTRACGVAIALLHYRTEQKSDGIFSLLSLDDEPFLRYAAMFVCGLAYCGTSSNEAIRALLHVSVTDTSDDVRRAAVVALGFVLCDSPEKAPKVLSLLTESHNPHVRYGAAFAVGVACCGFGGLDAVNLLQPLTQDKDDVVRQATFMSLGLVLMNVPEGQLPDNKVKLIKDTLWTAATAKSENSLARLGAIISIGLLNAGGRNVISSVFTNFGHLRRTAVAGMLMYSQMWFWLPLIHGIALTLQPAMLVGITPTGQMPVHFTVKQNAPASRFAYPAPTEIQPKKSRREMKKAVLSTTMKRRTEAAKQADAKKAKHGDATVESKVLVEVLTSEADPTPTPPAEPKFVILSNPTRVLPAQEGLMEFLIEMEDPTEVLPADQQQETTKRTETTPPTSAASASAPSADIEMRDAEEAMTKKEEETKEPIDIEQITEEMIPAESSVKAAEPSEGAEPSVAVTEPSPSPELSMAGEGAGPMDEPEGMGVCEKLARYYPMVPSRHQGFVVLWDMQPQETPEYLVTMSMLQQKSEVVTPPDQSAEAISEEMVPPPADFEWDGVFR